MCSVCDGTGLLLQDECPLCDGETSHSCRACLGTGKFSDTEGCPLCDGVVGWPQCEEFTELTILSLAGSPIMTVEARQCIELQTIQGLRRKLQTAELKSRRIVKCSLMLDDALLEDGEMLGSGRLCGSQTLQAVFRPYEGKARKLLRPLMTPRSVVVAELTSSLEIIAALRTLEESDHKIDHELARRVLPRMADWLHGQYSSMRAVRLVAIFAISRLKGERSQYLRSLVNALGDDSSTVRYEVARVLQDIVTYERRDLGRQAKSYDIMKNDRRTADRQAAKEFIMARSATIPEEGCSRVSKRLHKLYSALALPVS